MFKKFLLAAMSIISFKKFVLMPISMTSFKKCLLMTIRMTSFKKFLLMTISMTSFKKFLLTASSMTLLWIQSSSSTAQTTLDFQSPKTAQTKSSAPIPPSEFSNQIKATNTQNHNQFKQQLDQQKSTLSHPTIPTLSQVQSMTQTPPPASLSAPPESTNENAASAPAKKNKLTHLPSNAEQTMTQAPTPAASNTTAPNAATTAPSPAVKPIQPQQPYTGFPTQSPLTGGGTEQKNSGSFNIQY
jgi:hypothetical protein